MFALVALDGPRRSGFNLSPRYRYCGRACALKGRLVSFLAGCSVLNEERCRVSSIRRGITSCLANRSITNVETTHARLFGCGVVRGLRRARRFARFLYRPGLVTATGCGVHRCPLSITNGDPARLGGLELRIRGTTVTRRGVNVSPCVIRASYHLGRRRACCCRVDECRSRDALHSGLQLGAFGRASGVGVVLSITGTLGRTRGRDICRESMYPRGVCICRKNGTTLTGFNVT